MSTHAERVEVLLRVTSAPVPDDLMTWRVDGRIPTSDEIRMLHAMTTADVADAKTLRDLDREIEASFNEHLGDE